MCDYEGCTESIGMIDVIRVKDHKELKLCPHCAYCHLITELVFLNNSRAFGGD